MTLATYLTFLRISLIPVMVAAFYLPLEGSGILAAAIFALASLTDWLDGYLARRFRETTPFGAFLDPVADKLMVVAALLLLVQNYPTPWMALAAMAIIGREIAIVSLREWIALVGRGERLTVSTSGKIKTTLQMVAITLLLLATEVDRRPLRLGGGLLLFAAVVMTLWSLWDYLRQIWPLIPLRPSRRKVAGKVVDCQ